VPERRASRFALEVIFLVALAVALTLADLEPLVVGGLMLLGWVIVALLEWAAWRDEPHYGSGLPPRYYVPQVALPPRQPLEQVGGGYPAADGRDDAPTWIASPALRAEVLGAADWPVAPHDASEDTQEDESLAPDDAAAEGALGADTEPDLEAVSADGPEPVDDPRPVPVVAVEEPAATEPEAEPEPEPDPEPVVVAEAALVTSTRRRRLWGRRADSDTEVDPWVVAELPVEPDEPPAVEPEPVAEVTELVPAQHAASLHRLDPLAEPERKRWRRQRGTDNGFTVEMPARPAVPRVLPGRSRREE
jgi:hypothetical protein